MLKLCLLQGAGKDNFKWAYRRLTNVRKGINRMLYIMRYGKTDWNVQHKLQGRIDIPNNEKYMKNVQNTYVKLFLYATI